MTNYCEKYPKKMGFLSNISLEFWEKKEENGRCGEKTHETEQKRPAHERGPFEYDRCSGLRGAFQMPESMPRAFSGQITAQCSFRCCSLA